MKEGHLENPCMRTSTFILLACWFRMVSGVRLWSCAIKRVGKKS